MYPRDVEECRKAILKVEVNIGKWIRVDQQGICNYPNKHFLFIMFNVVSNLLTIFPYRSIFCHQLARKRLRFILGSIKLWFGGMVYLWSQKNQSDRHYWTQIFINFKWQQGRSEHFKKAQERRTKKFWRR